MRNGLPTVVRAERRRPCVQPFLAPSGADDPAARTARSPAEGRGRRRMDGFIRVTDRAHPRLPPPPHSSACAAPPPPNVHELPRRRQIPNYWAYARNFVLQDHMFEPNWGWSLPAHLWLVSGWSAQCRNPYKASTCTTNLADGPGTARAVARIRTGRSTAGPTSPTSSTSTASTWASYVQKGRAPDCLAGPIRCYTRLKGASRRACGTRFRTSPTCARTTSAPPRRSRSPTSIRGAARTLPNVSWVTPDWADSDHPGARSARAGVGDEARERRDEGPDWKSSAIFLAWDDWGGFYDHVEPPVVDRNGYGLRVPGS
jgi:phospholipase C